MAGRTPKAVAEARSRGLVILAPRALGKLNRSVLSRDGYRCRIRRLDVCTGTAEQVHHTFGWKVTGDDPSYMMAACTACNAAVGEPMKSSNPPVRPKAWL
jgi:hypothetical protein